MNDATMQPVALSAALVRLQDQLTEGRLAVAASTRDAIGNTLGTLYSAAEQGGNADAMALITTAWDKTNALYAEAASLQNIAAGAMTVALASKTDRDALAEQMSEIEDAVTELLEYGNTDHPLLAGVEETVADSIFSAGIHIVSPADTAMENGWWDFELEGSAVDAVVEALFLSRAEALPHDLALELATFLNQWGAKVDAWSQDLDADEPEELLF